MWSGYPYWSVCWPINFNVLFLQYINKFMISGHTLRNQFHSGACRGFTALTAPQQACRSTNKKPLSGANLQLTAGWSRANKSTFAVENWLLGLHFQSFWNWKCSSSTNTAANLGSSPLACPLWSWWASFFKKSIHQYSDVTGHRSNLPLTLIDS